MIEMNAPKGLGDAIYLRAAVLHLLEKGEEITVYTRWPELFEDLHVTIKTLNDLPVNRENFRSVTWSGERTTVLDEFSTRCKYAGIEEPVKLRLDWKIRNQPLLDKIKADANGRDILIFQPLKRPKNEAMELLRPDRKMFEKFLVEHSQYYRIKLGHPPSVDDDDLPCELDMYGKGFIFDTFDICHIGDLFFGEVCFMHTIAEALDKHVVCMFSRASQRCDAWPRNITPGRVFHKPHLSTAIYDD